MTPEHPVDVQLGGDRARGGLERGQALRASVDLGARPGRVHDQLQAAHDGRHRLLGGVEEQAAERRVPLVRAQQVPGEPGSLILGRDAASVPAADADRRERRRAHLEDGAAGARHGEHALDLEAQHVESLRRRVLLPALERLQRGGQRERVEPGGCGYGRTGTSAAAYQPLPGAGRRSRGVRAIGPLAGLPCAHTMSRSLIPPQPGVPLPVEPTVPTQPDVASPAEPEQNGAHRQRPQPPRLPARRRCRRPDRRRRQRRRLHHRRRPRVELRRPGHTRRGHRRPEHGSRERRRPPAPLRPPARPRPPSASPAASIPPGWTEHDIAARDVVRRYVGNLAPALAEIYPARGVRQAGRHPGRRRQLPRAPAEAVLRPGPATC